MQRLLGAGALGKVVEQQPEHRGSQRQGQQKGQRNGLHRDQAEPRRQQRLHGDHRQMDDEPGCQQGQKTQRQMPAFVSQTQHQAQEYRDEDAQ